MDYLQICPTKSFVLFYKLDNCRIRVYILSKSFKLWNAQNCLHYLLKAAKYVMKFLSKYIFLRKLGTTLIAAAESIR